MKSCHFLIFVFAPWAINHLSAYKHCHTSTRGWMLGGVMQACNLPASDKHSMLFYDLSLGHFDVYMPLFDIHTFKQPHLILPGFFSPHCFIIAQEGITVWMKKARQEVDSLKNIKLTAIIGSCWWKVQIKWALLHQAISQFWSVVQPPSSL